jgi:hypothetical protein
VGTPSPASPHDEGADSGPARGPGDRRRSQRPQGPSDIGRRIRCSPPSHRTAPTYPRTARAVGAQHAVDLRETVIPRPATPYWPPPRRTRQGRSGGTGSKPWPY